MICKYFLLFSEFSFYSDDSVFDIQKLLKFQKVQFVLPVLLVSNLIFSCLVEWQEVSPGLKANIKQQSAWCHAKRRSLFHLVCGKVLGASVRNSAHSKGHEEGSLAYAKASSSLRKPPVPEHLPPKQSLFYALTYTSDFTGGSPP